MPEEVIIDIPTKIMVEEDEATQLFEEQCGFNMNGANPVEALRKVVQWIREKANES